MDVALRRKSLVQKKGGAVVYLQDVLQPQRQRHQVEQVRYGEVNQINAKLILLLQVHGCVV